MKKQKSKPKTKEVGMKNKIKKLWNKIENYKMWVKIIIVFAILITIHSIIQHQEIIMPYHTGKGTHTKGMKKKGKKKKKNKMKTKRR